MVRLPNISIMKMRRKEGRFTPEVFTHSLNDIMFNFHTHCSFNSSSDDVQSERDQAVLPKASATSARCIKTDGTLSIVDKKA